MGRSINIGGVLVDPDFDPDFNLALERAFLVTSRGLDEWPNPNPDADPPDEAYSRLTDPGRWRIIGARADAWRHALSATGRAVVDRAGDTSAGWASASGPVISRTDVVRPVADGGLELTIGRTQLGPCDDAGVVIGVGTPAIQIDRFPECGCDACDWGSQPELDRLDELLAAVVTGEFRHLVDRDRHITVGRDGARGWGSRSGGLSRGDVDAILAASEPPPGWRQWRGAPWRPDGSTQRTPR